MSELIGYARCSTAGQDLTAQRGVLRELGVGEPRIYLDHGLTGRNRDRPGLQLALAAVREDDTLVVPKLDRLARSVPDARAIADELEQRGVRLQLGVSSCRAGVQQRDHELRDRSRRVATITGWAELLQTVPKHEEASFAVLTL